MLSDGCIKEDKRQINEERDRTPKQMEEEPKRNRAELRTKTKEFMQEQEKDYASGSGNLCKEKK